MNQTIIKNIFEREYNNQPNFMTPSIIKYGKKGKFVYEVSKGKSIVVGETIYGLTILELVDNRKNLVNRRRSDLSKCCHSLAELESAIESLK